jgi:hypothetical protein
MYHGGEHNPARYAQLGELTIARLMFLVGYAQHGTAWRREDVALPEAPGLVPVMAQVLWRQTERALRQGLLPGYVTLEETSYVLRGRLRETEQLHRQHGLPIPLEIRHKAEQPAGYPNADLYQLLAYCTVLGLDCGHLVYAKGSEEPAHHVVRRSGIEIICHAVDLDSEPGVLLHQMQDLASHIAASSVRPPIGPTSLTRF